MSEKEYTGTMIVDMLNLPAMAVSVRPQPGVFTLPLWVCKALIADPKAFLKEVLVHVPKVFEGPKS